MQQVVSQHGQAVVREVPVPIAEPGTVLVHVDHSCISVGTEMSGLRASGTPLWKRAIQDPHFVKRAVRYAASQGLSKTRERCRDHAVASAPIGYSAAGTVCDAGPGVTEFQVEDRVACAGAQCAHHAEFIRVPVNLAVRVPKEVSLAEASTVALGAIALQGVRRAAPTLGETFVTVGLGILGQLTAQMLQANGCRVIGADLDRSRIELARQLGIQHGLHPHDGNNVEQVARLTDGIGADGVIVTAATASHEVLSMAFQMCRRKGRVVLVGDVGLNLDRADIYAKELDFLVSTSYGPGRYDERYEEHGLDYPVGYVRWTENRNMREYLRLVADGKIQVGPLVSEIHPVTDCTQAYERLKSDADRPLMVLLSYPKTARRSRPSDEDRRCVPISGSQPAEPGTIRIALVGPGAFARDVHLPNLRQLDDRFQVAAVVARSGHSAASIAQQYRARYATTDYQALLSDAEIDAVLIATRHHLHADQALAALQAGKHVLLEKPLALTREERDKIASFYSSASGRKAVPMLLTGFNRRFSPLAQEIQQVVSNRTNPMVINYVMNAGYLPMDHWVHGEEGGGRNLGEACHIYDLFTFLTDARVRDIDVKNVQPTTEYYSVTDNFVTSIAFDDGSLATLTYTALGSPEFPKEQMQVFVDGKVIGLEDYKRAYFKGVRRGDREYRRPDKGHKAELEAFANAITNGGDWPIPLWQQLQATDIALHVERCLTQHGRSGRTPIDDEG